MNCRRPGSLVNCGIMHWIRSVSGLMLLGLLLAGCGNQAPAPVVYGPRDGLAQRPGDRIAAPAQSETRPAEAAGDEITVQRGDTVYGLARRHNQPVRAFVEANGLRPPYILQPGQRLRLVGDRFHVVQSGDTLYTVSRQYGVDTYALARSNDLNPPYNLTNGQSLRIPTAQPVPPVLAAPLREAAPASATAVATAPATSSASGVTMEALPPPGTSARAPSGSTPPPALPRAQPLPEVSVPARSTEPVTAAVPASPARPGPQPNVQEPATQAAPDAEARAPARAEPPSAQAPSPQVRPAEPEPQIAEPPPRSGRTFSWPVRGRILSTFGPKPDGLHNDGINIAARSGAPVIAAENGVVVYAGSELKGFGNLLLLRHADGWITAYAHLDKALVQKGQNVRKGQAIGTVGSSGGVDQPQLHFEIRRGTQAVDPAKFLTIALLEPDERSLTWLLQGHAQPAGQVLNELPRDPA